MPTVTASQNNRKKTVRSSVFPVVVCIAGGELVTVILAAFFSFVFALVDLPEIAVMVFVFVALIFGAVVTGRLCARAFPEERGTMSIICGLMMVLILVLANLIFFREPITALSFGKYAAILLPAFLIAAVTKPARSRGKKKLKKR